MFSFASCIHRKTRGANPTCHEIYHQPTWRLHTDTAHHEMCLNRDESTTDLDLKYGTANVRYTVCTAIETHHQHHTILFFNTIDDVCDRERETERQTGKASIKMCVQKKRNASLYDGWITPCDCAARSPGISISVVPRRRHVCLYHQTSFRSRQLHTFSLVWPLTNSFAHNPCVCQSPFFR